ncbi:MAG TPA: hypothetical protein VLA45_19810 [Paracoccaceae bacterium]|nr:hypothetical protein [Paracoccaceae bacterium]
MVAFAYSAPARSPRSALILIGIWAVLAAGWIWLDVEAWIVGALALFSLPLLAELVLGRTAHLTLDKTEIRWHSARQSEAVKLREIKRAQFQRRLDGTMSVTLVLRDGRTFRLPQDCVAPRAPFEAALNSAGVRTEPVPFSIF